MHAGATPLPLHPDLTFGYRCCPISEWLVVLGSIVTSSQILANVNIVSAVTSFCAISAATQPRIHAVVGRSITTHGCYQCPRDVR